MRGWGSTCAHGITGCGRKAWSRETYTLVALFKCLEGRRRYVFPPSRHCNDTCILLWCLDLQIWRFLCWQTDGETWLLYPSLANVRRVIIMHALDIECRPLTAQSYISISLQAGWRKGEGSTTSSCGWFLYTRCNNIIPDPLSLFDVGGAGLWD